MATCMFAKSRCARQNPCKSNCPRISLLHRTRIHLYCGSSKLSDQLHVLWPPGSSPFSKERWKQVPKVIRSISVNALAASCSSKLDCRTLPYFFVADSSSSRINLLNSTGDSRIWPIVSFSRLRLVSSSRNLIFSSLANCRYWTPGSALACFLEVENRSINAYLG